MAVQIRIFHIGPGQCKVKAGGDGQGGLVHAADHHLQVGGTGYGIDFQRLVDAPDLHQLDVDHIHQAFSRQPEGVLEIHQAFVGHDGQRDLAGDASQQAILCPRGGLFDEFQACRPHRRHELQDVRLGIALVGIEAQFDFLARRLREP
jgi:hypothetical protein